MDKIIALSSSEEFSDGKEDDNALKKVEITKEEMKPTFKAPHVTAPDYSEYVKCDLTNRPDCINLIREVKRLKHMNKIMFIKWLLTRTVPENHAKILGSADQIQMFTEKRQLVRWIKEQYLRKEANEIFRHKPEIGTVSSFVYGMLFCIFLIALSFLVTITIFVKLDILNRQKMIYLHSLKNVLISILQN